MAKIKVFSKFEFDEFCENNNITDDNVEKLTVCAFISIIGTPDVIREHIMEEEDHHFKENHENVLNLEFDDVEEDITFGDNDQFIAKAMTSEDANKILNFVEKNLGKDIYVHCRAGASRSQAVFMAICAIWPDVYDEKENYNPDNPCLTPNIHVLATIKRKAYNNMS